MHVWYKYTLHIMSFSKMVKFDVVCDRLQNCQLTNCFNHVLLLIIFLSIFPLDIRASEAQIIDQYIAEYGHQLDSQSIFSKLYPRQQWEWVLCCILLFCFLVTNLRICPSSSTVCTRNVEEKLISMAEAELSKDIEDSFNSVHSLFLNRRNKFDGKFVIFWLR